MYRFSGEERCRTRISSAVLEAETLPEVTHNCVELIIKRSSGATLHMLSYDNEGAAGAQLKTCTHTST